MAIWKYFGTFDTYEKYFKYYDGLEHYEVIWQACVRFDSWVKQSIY